MRASPGLALRNRKYWTRRERCNRILRVGTLNQGADIGLGTLRVFQRRAKNVFAHFLNVFKFGSVISCFQAWPRMEKPLKLWGQPYCYCSPYAESPPLGKTTKLIYFIHSRRGIGENHRPRRPSHIEDCARPRTVFQLSDNAVRRRLQEYKWKSRESSDLEHSEKVKPVVTRKINLESPTSPNIRTEPSPESMRTKTGYSGQHWTGQMAPLPQGPRGSGIC